MRVVCKEELPDDPDSCIQFLFFCRAAALQRGDCDSAAGASDAPGSAAAIRPRHADL